MTEGGVGVKGVGCEINLLARCWSLRSVPSAVYRIAVAWSDSVDSENPSRTMARADCRRRPFKS